MRNNLDKIGKKPYTKNVILYFLLATVCITICFYGCSGNSKNDIKKQLEKEQKIYYDLNSRNIQSDYKDSNLVKEMYRQGKKVDSLKRLAQEP